MTMFVRNYLRVALMGSVATLAPAFAQNALTVTSEVVYNDNPGLAAVGGGHVTLVRFNPQYTIRREPDSSTLTEFVFGGLVERSSNTDLSANRSLPRASARWQRSTDRSVLELRASLEEESTRATQFADFGTVTIDSTSRSGLLGGRWANELSATSAVELTASHRRVNYDTAALVDFAETQTGASYLLRSGANVRYTMVATAGHINFSGANRSASLFGLKGGYERDLTENVTVNVDLGAVRVNLPTSDTHPVGSLRLAHEGERLGYVIAWAHDVRASGLGGYERFASVDASLTYPLSADSRLSMGASRVRSLLISSDVGTSAYVRLQTELTRNWSFTTGLELRHAAPAGRPSARGGAIMFGLVYDNPNF